MATKDPNIIRVGDYVQVINPLVVNYVGYPQHPKHYILAASIVLRDADIIRQVDLPGKQRASEQKLIKQLAYHMCVLTGFGGNERKVRLKQHPEIKVGDPLYVNMVKYAKEGIRRYEGSEEGYSFELQNTCKLLGVRIWSETVWIPASHVEKRVP